MQSDETRDVEMTSDPEEGEEGLMPFMDTFYSLASNEAEERSFAASSMIKCLFYKSDWDQDSIDATVKDGSYALTRLMNGLCSGRASARQGFASCLSTFLKVSFKMGPENESKKRWIDLFMSDSKANNAGADEFVRNTLKDCTNFEGPAKGKKNTGKKSRSDERDYRFGRLFGILSIVRSGSLVDASEKVMGDYVTDLLGLYEHKNWFREPACASLMEFFSTLSNQVDLDVFGKLVQISVSSFFNFEKKPSCPWSVEKIALYLHLQTIYMDKNEHGIPKCLKTPLLTASNLDEDIGGGVMNLMLRDTSETLYPKVHLVWKSMWSYLSEKSDGKQKLRGELIVGTDSAIEIIEALVDKVVVETLLGEEVEGEGFVSATPGRRALGLSLLQQMFALNLPSEIVQNSMLQKSIVTNLFVNTLQKFSGGQKKHTLKPLALDVLQSIVGSLCAGPLDQDNAMRRFGASKAFLTANPSFDSVTKTDTVTSLLDLENRTDTGAEGDTGHSLLWESHFTFVVEEINARLSAGEESSQEANKYIDMLFAFVKRVFRVGNEAEKETIFKRTLSFFMIGAFFNLEKFNERGDKKDSLLQTAYHLKTKVGNIPFVARALMSSRFFSLISEYINASSFQRSEGTKESLKDKKTQVVLQSSSLVRDFIRTLQGSGAHLDCDSAREVDDTVLGSMDACDNMKKLFGDETNESESKTRAVTALVGLASSLTFQLLQPGLQGDSNADDNIDMEDEDITEDIMEMISDLTAVTTIVASEEDNQEDGNVLNSLAEVCVGILNSSCGGSGLQPSKIRGGASKITRECLQTAWTATLTLAGTSNSVCLDADVINTLLEAICSQNVLEQGGEEDSDQDMSDEDDGSSIESGNDDMQLSFVSATSAAIDSESDNDDLSANSETKNETGSDDSMNEREGEIELESSKLENLLIQSSDDDDSVDGNMLEHHEGADAALAQLIKLKQEARKSGKDQKEKLELSNRLRCMALLESVFLSNKRSGLLSNQAVLMSILPLLRSRTELAKSLSTGNSSQNDKASLLDKITILLESKVAKTNIDGMANIEACKIVADQVSIEMRKLQDIEHCRCCSALLVLLVKAVAKQGDETITFTKSLYEPCVHEWSTKKSTKLQAVIFDDLATKCQSAAKLVLTAPLIEGSINARNAFLRTECFRILTSLYILQAPNEKSDVADDVSELKKQAVDLSKSLVSALRDEEMMKAKRAREIVKCAERLVKFANIHGDATIWSGFEELQSATKALVEKSESSAIQSACKKLESEIESGAALFVEKNAVKKIESVKSPSSSSKKKGNKKSKKKKN